MPNLWHVGRISLLWAEAVVILDLEVPINVYDIAGNIWYQRIDTLCLSQFMSTRTVLSSPSTVTQAHIRMRVKNQVTQQCAPFPQPTEISLSMDGELQVYED